MAVETILIMRWRNPPPEALLKCNDGAYNCIQRRFARHPYRLLGVGVQTLARHPLPRRLTAKALVRAVRAGFRHGGDQRELLPAAACVHLRRLATESA